MTRFARVEGANAKKQYEEATPWETMKAEMQRAAKKEKKKIKKHIEKPIEPQPGTSLQQISAEEIPLGDEYKAFKINMPVKRNCEPTTDNLNGTSKKVKKNKKMSFEEKKKNYVTEEGQKFKVLKSGERKPWFDLPYEENDVMTRYKNFYVKKEMVAKLDEFKRTLEKQGLDEKKISRIMLRKESKVHNQLRVELLREEIAKNKMEGNISLKETTNENYLEKYKNETTPKNKKINKPSGISNFEESDLMTLFEGYWVLRENVELLKAACEEIKRNIINGRTDGNTEPDLTQTEEVQYRRISKKEKRRENNLLKQRLKGSPKKKGGDGTLPRNELQTPRSELQTVKFDGYYIKKEGAQRLTEIREKMVEKGCTEEEIQKVLKIERRQEEKHLKNVRNIFCYQCRQVGHRISACPKNGEDAVEICFKCGSTEHMARSCSSNKGSGSVYSYATCYICGKSGHISRECPDNQNGVYPSGGCCNECGSIQHLKKNCPEFQQRMEETSLKASLYRRGQEVEGLDDDVVSKKEEQQNVRKKRKVIKFDK